MRKNRFEIVDEIQPDAITLELAPGGDPETGRLHIPAACTSGMRSEDYTSDSVPKVDAFRTAIAIANQLKVAIVVMDAEGVWMAEWGDLYRPAE